MSPESPGGVRFFQAVLPTHPARPGDGARGRHSSCWPPCWGLPRRKTRGRRGGAHPGRPQNFTATAGDTQVVLTWDAPADEGGTPITAYQYRAAVGATVPEFHSWIQLDGADSLEATVPGLTNGTQYAFEVRALNSSGTDAGPVAGPVATATTTPMADVTLTWNAREAGLEPSFTVTITFLEAVEGFTLDDISVTAINISDLPEEPGAFHQWELPAENFQTISATTYSVEVTLEPRTITIGPVANRTPRTLQPQKARVIIPVNAAQVANGGTPKRETPTKRTVTDISLTLTVPPVTGTEREALEAFYHATGGANWTSKDNWLDATKPLGEWHGVTTNSAGEVTRLILRGNELSGSLPAKLGNLRNLTRLYLDKNALSGAIPPELGHLRNLRLLLLHQNALSGAIPPDLGLLENLTHLYLHRNALRGAIPPKLGGLSKLQRLYLQGNDLSGAIPPELGRSSLVDLKLHSNADLSGPLPASFPTAMPDLKALGVQNTGVTIPETPAFTDWTARITSGTQTSDGVITLDTANTRPSGLWADSTRLYVVGEDGGKVYAYTLASGVRDAAKDIDLHTDNARPTGLWSDGETLYVLDYDDEKIYAYTLADGMRDTTKDISSDVSTGYGLWGNKDLPCEGINAICLLWRAYDGQSPITLRAYRIYEDPNLADTYGHGTRNTNYSKFLPTLDLLDIIYYVSGLWWEVPAPDDNPADDVATVWISNILSARLYAYSANPRAVEGSSDIVSAAMQDRILAPANLSPTALWSDGETWWVADFYAGKVFVYGPSAPPPTTIITPVVPLGVPQNFSATAGDTRVVLRWTAPASDGGTAITKYEYRYSAGSTVDTSATSATWTDVPDGADAGNETTVTVTDLTNGTQYAFEVRARNNRDGPAAMATATPTIPSTDATLRSLALSDASNNSTIALTPSFASGTMNYNYTASVANGVAQITIAATPTNSSASVAYLQQVSLEVGVNTITVQVTAADTVTMLTYTVMVTRRARETGTGTGGGGGGGGSSQDDHGNTPAQATPVTLDPTRTASTVGQLNPAADMDYFTVAVPHAGVLVVETSGPTATVGTVWQAGEELATADSGGVGQNFRLSVRVAPGPVVIAVAGNGQQTGRYTLQVTFLPGYLENPGAASFQSGIGVISGWVCDAEEVEIVLNGEPQEAAYGTARLDTEAVCGDSDNGFGLLFNWNLLEDGEHEVVALVDGVELDRATVTVTTLGAEFLRDVTGMCTVEDFPTMDETVTLAWQQTQQNFVIVDGAAPAGATRAGRAGVGYLENPGPNSFQSGIGVLSGWVCEGDEVVIELNGEPQPAAYGTERLDTLEMCGDTANGFGLLFNWNLLGEGAHEVVAFVDGEELGRATVRVTTLGAEFVRDVEGECMVEDFPMLGETVTLEWQQNSQNFVITEVEGGSTL